MGYTRRPRYARVCADCGGEGMNDLGYACSSCDGSGYVRRCRRCHVNDAPLARRTEEEQRRVGGLCWECEIAQTRPRIFDDRPVDSAYIVHGTLFVAPNNSAGER